MAIDKEEQELRKAIMAQAKTGRVKDQEDRDRILRDAAARLSLKELRAVAKDLDQVRHKARLDLKDERAGNKAARIAVDAEIDARNRGARQKKK